MFWLRFNFELTLREWYNGFQPIMGKPMKTLELHHPVVQFFSKNQYQMNPKRMYHRSP